MGVLPRLFNVGILPFYWCNAIFYNQTDVSGLFFLTSFSYIHMPKTSYTVVKSWYSRHMQTYPAALLSTSLHYVTVIIVSNILVRFAASFLVFWWLPLLALFACKKYPVWFVPSLKYSFLDILLSFYFLSFYVYSRRLLLLYH